MFLASLQERALQLRLNYLNYHPRPQLITTDENIGQFRKPHELSGSIPPVLYTHIFNQRSLEDSNNRLQPTICLVRHHEVPF